MKRILLVITGVKNFAGQSNETQLTQTHCEKILEQLSPGKQTFGEILIVPNFENTKIVLKIITTIFQNTDCEQYHYTSSEDDSLDTTIHDEELKQTIKKIINGEIKIYAK